MSFNKKNLFISTMLAASVATMATNTAYAQDSDNDEIIVTGSRLNVNPNLTSPQPVLSIDSAEIAARGVVNIEDLTNTLPQISAAQTADQSNGASGTSQLDLRGLGAQRTLSLIDGRRLPYGDSASVAVNIDLVPTNLVERVDVLTGGSSAVYGSDAVAGVDTEDGRGNIVGFASYQNRKDIIGADRTRSACTLGGGSTNGFGCVGSSNFRRFNNIAANFFQRPSERFQIYTKANYEIADGHELFADFGFTESTSDAQIAPSASFGFFQRTSNCDNPLFQDPVTEDGRSIAQAVLLCTPEEIATGQRVVVDEDGNPVLDANGNQQLERALVDGLTFTHRNVEGGPRNSRLENQAMRFVGGLRGTVADVWDYEVFGQYSKTKDQNTSTNDFQIDALAQAIDVVMVLQQVKQHSSSLVVTFRQICRITVSSHLMLKVQVLVSWLVLNIVKMVWMRVQTKSANVLTVVSQVLVAQHSLFLVS